MINLTATSVSACKEKEDLAKSTKHHHSEQMGRDGRNPFCLSTHDGTGKLPSRIKCARTRTADAVG